VPDCTDGHTAHGFANSRLPSQRQHEALWQPPNEAFATLDDDCLSAIVAIKSRQFPDIAATSKRMSVII